MLTEFASTDDLSHGVTLHGHSWRMMLQRRNAAGVYSRVRHSAIVGLELN